MAALLASFFLKTWSQRGFFAILLWPCSKLFELLLLIRRGFYATGLYQQTRLPVPVIVVGNIFVGGTGKTPMVIYLVEQLRIAGWTPGVISRGYGAQLENTLEVRADSLASEVGDEPLLIVQRTACPMMVGRRRVSSAQELLRSHPEVDILISDDGLQHYALARDVEIVMFDQRGVGNGWLLPAGPLREPQQRRRDFTVLNVGNDGAVDTQVVGIGKDAIKMRLQADQIVSLMTPSQRMTLAEVKGKRVLAAAGIGNPQRFFSMLTAQGLEFESLALPDHFAFTAEIFQQSGTKKNPSADVEIILITEKDAVKCRQITELKNDPRIWVVPVSAYVDAGFMPDLLKMISSK